MEELFTISNFYAELEFKHLVNGVIQLYLHRMSDNTVADPGFPEGGAGLAETKQRGICCTSCIHAVLSMAVSTLIYKFVC